MAVDLSYEEKGGGVKDLYSAPVTLFSESLIEFWDRIVVRKDEPNQSSDSSLLISTMYKLFLLKAHEMPGRWWPIKSFTQIWTSL